MEYCSAFERLKCKFVKNSIEINSPRHLKVYRFYLIQDIIAIIHETNTKFMFHSKKLKIKFVITASDFVSKIFLCNYVRIKIYKKKILSNSISWRIEESIEFLPRLCKRIRLRTLTDLAHFIIQWNLEEGKKLKNWFVLTQQGKCLSNLRSNRWAF